VDFWIGGLMGCLAELINFNFQKKSNNPAIQQSIGRTGHEKMQYFLPLDSLPAVDSWIAGVTLFLFQ
jgi:hypothetical protein